MIGGRLIGSVRGRRVILQSTAHVEGDLLHKEILLWSRAHISRASSRRSDDPLSAAKEQGEQTAVKPRQERAEGQRDKASSTFVRTLQELDSI